MIDTMSEKQQRIRRGQVRYVCGESYIMLYRSAIGLWVVGRYDPEDPEREIPAETFNREALLAAPLRCRVKLPKPDRTVTIETMPDHLRASHRAERRQVSPEEAEEIIEADEDGYAHIVT